MIGRGTINSLSDLERATLVYVLNEIPPAKVKIELDTVCCYKINPLRKKLKNAAGQIKPEHLEFYKILCSKFGVNL
jgi:hypothetical protein|tara:strand:+ start:31 stop:258 length:228 start_codon:yes stop_codon:yes gene_type:complete